MSKSFTPKSVGQRLLASRKGSAWSKACLTAAAAGAVLVWSQGAAKADVIYDSLPQVGIHTNSQAYQAQQMSEFGDEITFAPGSARTLTDVTVGLVNWATAAEYPSYAAADLNGFTVPMTLTIYSVGAGDTVGTQIATLTISQFITWDTGSALTQDVSFDFTGLGVTLPNSVIFDLAFDTETYGANPTGVDGPYDSLNFGLNNSDGSPSVGTDVNPSGVWLNTTNATWGDHTAGTFSQDTIGYPDNFGTDETAWTGRPPSIEFDAVPEPSTLALFSAALLGLGWLGFRRKRIA